MIHRPGKLSELAKKFSDYGHLYKLPESVLSLTKEEIKSRFPVFSIDDLSEFSEQVSFMSKKNVLEILSHLPVLMDLHGEVKIGAFIESKYCQYVFRKLYMLWQEYFHRKDIQRLMLEILKYPVTEYYLKELNFSPMEFKSILTAEDTKERIKDLAESGSISVREFFACHYIDLKSFLALDSISISLLFCSAEEFLRIGAEKLLGVIQRMDENNRAKIINNFYSKLTFSEREQMLPVIDFVFATHGYPDKPNQGEFGWGFWSYLETENINEMTKDINRRQVQV